MQLHQLEFRIRKMKEVLNELRIRAKADVAGIEISPRGKNEFVPFENGAFWGNGAGDNWFDFRFRCSVPEGFRGQAVLMLATGLDGWEATMPQVLVWVNGRIEQAFDTRHKGIILQEQAVPGTEFDIFLQAFHCIKGDDTGLMMPRLRMYWADTMDDVTQLYYDIDMPHQAAMLLEDGCREKEKTLEVISDALNLLDLRNPYSKEFHESVKAAREFLRVNYYEPLENREPESVAECVGHTHIDVAWLWDIYQTRHKAVRTFSTMLRLMEKYPEFKFMSSQAQLYQMVKEDAPDVYERIKDAVKRGQWEPEGGMWVEADCNLSGGEALIRQFLYGNELFVNDFDRRSEILWLPDVFGYSAALPQILKKSGIKYFETSKLSWSEFNCTPYDTFMWKGIDGTEVLTHFTPTRDYAGGDGYEKHADLRHFTTYNAMITPTQIKGGWKRFQQKGLDNHFLVSYGYGDGGGGSCDWMIENARRMKGPVAGCPVVKQSFPSEFFHSLEKRVSGNKRLPKWSGELYLEYHRGTYTSQAKNKKNNRKSEIAVRDAEFWLTLAADRGLMEYPQDELREIWHQILVLQFHDILPGSSIHKVYTDSDEMYAGIFARLSALRDRAVSLLEANAPGDIRVLNTLSHVRSDIVEFTGPEGITGLRDADGNVYPAQKVEDKYIAFVRDIQPMSAAPMWFVYGETEAESVHADEKGFETPFFKGSFDGCMRIDSLFDKSAGRQIVKAGKALNTMVCYENRPHNYDAWDVNIYYTEHSWEVDELISVEKVSEGPVAAVLRTRHRCNNSVIEQDIVVYNDIGRVDFKTRIDWKEPHLLLKAHFPVDVFYNAAQFDIQYGNVTRATHKNTSWDVARFEVCAHKWIDAGEPGYGAAMLNDCKYGHSVDEDSMAITMLKGATYPDETADQCEHEFSYAFMPHRGDWRSANVPEAAYNFNIPLEVCRGSGSEGKAEKPFAAVDCPNVIIESVKKALHGEGTIIRFYECFGTRTQVRLTLGSIPKEVMLTGMMEDDIKALPFEGDSVALEIKPYEIITLRIK